MANQPPTAPTSETAARPPMPSISPAETVRVATHIAVPDAMRTSPTATINVVTAAADTSTNPVKNVPNSAPAVLHADNRPTVVPVEAMSRSWSLMTAGGHCAQNCRRRQETKRRQDENPDPPTVSGSLTENPHNGNGCNCKRAAEHKQKGKQPPRIDVIRCNATEPGADGDAGENRADDPGERFQADTHVGRKNSSARISRTSTAADVPVTRATANQPLSGRYPLSTSSTLKSPLVLAGGTVISARLRARIFSRGQRLHHVTHRHRRRQDLGNSHSATRICSPTRHIHLLPLDTHCDAWLHGPVGVPHRGVSQTEIPSWSRSLHWPGHVNGDAVLLRQLLLLEQSRSFRRPLRESVWRASRRHVASLRGGHLRGSAALLSSRCR